MKELVNNMRSRIKNVKSETKSTFSKPEIKLITLNEEDINDK